MGLNFHLFLIGERSSSNLDLAVTLIEEVWSAEYKKIFGNRYAAAPLRLSEFTAIAALFDGNKAIAAHTITEINLKSRNKKGRFDSTILNDRVAEEMMANGISKVLAPENLVIAKEYRKNCYPLPLPYILLALSQQYFFSTDNQIIIALARNRKGINNVLYQLGYVPHTSDIIYNGEPSDLAVCFKNAERLDAGPEMSLMISSLWNNRLVEDLREMSLPRAEQFCGQV